MDVTFGIGRVFRAISMSSRFYNMIKTVDVGWGVDFLRMKRNGTRFSLCIELCMILF